MEYIKKEELIKGEIYTHKNGNIFRCDQINNATIYGKYINIAHNVFRKPPENPGNFWINEIRLATPGEKHWLNCCITANKFITFEEAMKTFIPEYVELINTGCRINCNIPAGKIYKCSKDVTKDYNFGFFLDSKYRIGFNKNEFNQYLKLSTKEAYDAQFVVKEPAENKTELEIWLENTKSLNLSLEDLEEYIESNQTCNFDNIYMKLEGHHSKGRAKILFDKWNEKVIEPLPQFKVIETIETITKVENNEGNQFFIGDIVISDSGFVQTIKSFRYNVNKDNVLATTNVCNQISIARLEHYIEPKVE